MTERWETDKLLMFRLGTKPPHWIDNADSYICSECGHEVSEMMVYCPRCGAKLLHNSERKEKQ